ncbi:MAG: nickel pincer cofactor biosynthesis protein LarC [Phycisphaerae bacterium]
MNILYIDAFSGISGDMFLGALVDAGLAEADLRAALATLPIEGYELEVRREKRGSLAATRVEVKLDAKAKQPHRHLSDIETILGAGNGARALEVFRRLAEAEARVHGTTAQEVHFHEVGAVDAIVDIFGVCAGLEILGVERVVSSGLPMGSGHVDAAHGRLPVPVPAVVELMRGFPVRLCEEEGELVTPTGAALAVTLADAFGPMPAMVMEKVGYGAGAREGKHVPNVLRVILGRAAGPDAAESDSVWLLEANLDDATGETVGAATQALFEAGAVDVWVTAAMMKKGRPGMVLSCLAPEGLVGAVEEAFFRETPTFGVRRVRAERSKLAREHVEVETRFGRVRVKVGRRGGRIVTASPEYEDCRRAAAERSVAVREVYGAAMEAWRGNAERGMNGGADDAGA